jgi:hypothetical protein
MPQRLVMTGIYVIYHLDLYVASMVTSVDGIRAVVLALRTLLMISVSPIHVSNTIPLRLSIGADLHYTAHWIYVAATSINYCKAYLLFVVLM